MRKTNYSIIVPSKIYPRPSIREMSTAYIPTNFFKADVKFIARTNNKTPDFLIDGKTWELKAHAS